MRMRIHTNWLVLLLFLLRGRNPDLDLHFLEFDLSTSGILFQVRSFIHVCNRWNWWENPQVKLMGKPTGELVLWQLASAWVTPLCHILWVVFCRGTTVEASLEGGPWLATWWTTFVEPCYKSDQCAAVLGPSGRLGGRGRVKWACR